MEYRNLGNTDQQISRVGLGCWAFGGHGWGRVDDEDSLDAIRSAFEAGVNFFDTADVYGFGHSEEILSAALGTDVKNVVIATKFGVRWDEAGKIKNDISPAYVRQAVTASLKRLKLDCIPLYQIHSPDGRTPVSDTLGELEKLRDEGKLRWIGISNFPPALVRGAQGFIRVESSQFEYSLVERGAESEDLPLCIEYQMAGLTYGSLAKGLLAAKFSAATTFPVNDTRSRDKNFKGARFAHNVALASRIVEIGKGCGKSAGQVAIRWILQRPGVACAIIGAKQRAQVLDNLGALGWALTDEDIHLIDRLATSAALRRSASV